MIKGYSIKELANIANLSSYTIYAMEKPSNKKPYFLTVRKLCSALEISPSYVYDTSNWPENTSGQIIKKYRYNLALSIKDLAALCNIHESTLANYESGRLHEKDTLSTIYKVLNNYKK